MADVPQAVLVIGNGRLPIQSFTNCCATPWVHMNPTSSDKSCRTSHEYIYFRNQYYVTLAAVQLELTCLGLEVTTSLRETFRVLFPLRLLILAKCRYEVLQTTRPGDRHGKLASGIPTKWSHIGRRRWTVHLTYYCQRSGGGTILPSLSRVDIGCALVSGQDGPLLGWPPTLTLYYVRTARILMYFRSLYVLRHSI